jgi:O-antigen/teichoic acid export membrane protein
MTDGKSTNIIKNAFQPEAVDAVVVTPGIVVEGMPRGETEAQHLLKRTPHSYLFNQAYGLWFFVSWFLLTVIITREVSTEQYGVFAIALTAYNTILYVVAFGLEDATTTYIPRIFAEYGQATAALLTRRLLVLRMGTLVVSVGIMIFGLPVLAAAIGLLPLQEVGAITAGLRDPELLAHIIPIAVYVFGSSIGSLLNAVCAALMRMRMVFVIGSITQCVILGLGFAVLKLGWGINGVLWLLAVTSLFNAAAFAFWLFPFLIARGAEYRQPLVPVVKLGISAWLTNLVTGALLKQISIILLGLYAVSLVEVGYFNLAFQLADSANLLLVAGFGGVAGSALAAAFIGMNHERLSRSWQALIKVETLLAAPGLVFCLFNAPNIAHALYGSSFDPVGPLLAIFLFFNIIVRVLGTTIHQSTLYVVGKAKLVVLGQWIGILIVVVLGAFLIGGLKLGPAGALIADGIAKSITGILLLVFLWRDLPHKYPLGFTLRFLLALTLAALPGVLWHPSDRILLVISGCIFLLLCFGLLLWIKPLDAKDMEMLDGVNPAVTKYLRWFARK